MIARASRTKSAAATLAVVAACCAGPAVARDMTGKGGVGLLIVPAAAPVAALRYWRTNQAFEVLVGWDKSYDFGARPVAQKDPASLCTPPQRDVVDFDFTGLRVAGSWLKVLADHPRATLALGVRPWVQIDYDTEHRVPHACEVVGKQAVEPATGTPIWGPDGKPVQQVGTRSERWTAGERVSRTPTSLRLGLDVPLQAELFLNDHFGLQGYVAISLRRGAPAVRDPSGLAARAGAESWSLDLGGAWSGGAGATFYF
jgi:hypothetical protein